VQERPILIRAEGDVGHGARSLSRTVGLTVDTMAFFAHELGLSPNHA
jgi:prolyl oligopeptidase